MDLEDDITRILASTSMFEPSLSLERTPSGRVGGIVCSESFAGMTPLERQNWIWSTSNSGSLMGNEPRSLPSSP